MHIPVWVDHDGEVYSGIGLYSRDGEIPRASAWIDVQLEREGQQASRGGQRERVKVVPG
jgi:hypothetical protein